eukprot:12221824-Karenia_brevis.AAC.1
MAHSTTMRTARQQVLNVLRGFSPMAKHQAPYCSKAKESALHGPRLARGSAAEALIKLTGFAQALGRQC